jgi:signal peptidase
MMPETHLDAACCDLVADVVRSKGIASLGVTGSSMLPAIRPGDVLTIKRHKQEELQPGEVVLFRRNGRLTAHRILSSSIDGLLTQGDSLPAMDQPVPAGEVVGLVVKIERNGRTLSPRRSFGQTCAAAMMRRSEWCKRIYLRLSGKLEQFGIFASKFEY